jgi:predicted DNA-binding transcriptional regulator AlpA
MSNPNSQSASPKTESRRMRTPVAAAWLGVSKSFLEKLRLPGDGPRFAKLGKIIVYEDVDLDAWAQARKRDSTSASRR